jgi:hypothetical protein
VDKYWNNTVEFTEQADQVLLIAEILERKQTEMIKRGAIQKVISIADSNQDHPMSLWDCQKTSVNALTQTISRMLKEQA